MSRTLSIWLSIFQILLCFPAQAQVMHYNQPTPSHSATPQIAAPQVQEPQLAPAGQPPQDDRLPSPLQLFQEQMEKGGLQPAGQKGDHSHERVVLLHGMGHGPRTMADFQQAFEAQGYKVSNLKQELERDTLHIVIDEAYRDIRRYAERDGETIHFVCYSQGCLVARGIIQQHRPPYMGRVVMLGPPNQGGEMVDYLRQRQLSTFINEGRHLPNLGTGNRRNLARLIGDSAEGYDLGIVAGTETNANLLPVAIPGANQTVLGSARTQLPGMKEFVAVELPHDNLYREGTVQALAMRFIQTGSFNEHGKQQ